MKFENKISQYKDAARSAFKPVAMIAAVELLGFSRLLQTGYLNRDDLYRAVTGAREWYLGNRYINEILSMFLHAGRRIADIGPLAQLIALVLMAITSYMTICVLADGRKIGWAQYIAVLPRTLFPYFIPCLLYKYDAPYMALSVLFGTIPLMYKDKSLKGYFAVSFLATIATSMTYQASLGVYPIMVLFVCFYFWKEAAWTAPKTFRFLGTSVLAYLLGLIVYKIVFVRYTISYATGTLFPARELPFGILKNYKKVYRNFYIASSRSWRVLMAALIICFIIYSIYTAKRSRVLAGVMSVLLIGVSSFLVVGPLIAFEKLAFIARNVYGIGTPLVLIAVILSFETGIKPGKLAAWALSWSFFVFSFIAGNALAEQMHYVDTRCQVILNELNDIVGADEEISYRFKGTSGYSPALREMVQNMKMLKTLQFPMVGAGYWDGYYFAEHYAGTLGTYKPEILLEDLTELTEIRNTKTATYYRSGDIILIEVKK